MTSVQLKIFLLFVAVASANLVGAQTIYVNASATGTDSGTSWQDAYTDLESALSSSSSGEIWVASGVYKATDDTDRTESLVLSSGMSLLGGFPNSGNPDLSDRDPTIYPTLLSGDLGVIGDTSDNSYTILVIDASIAGSTTVVDGFTITGGVADYSGGGVDISGSFSAPSSVTIRNCTFSSNYADYEGAGISASRVSLSVEGCLFIDNYSGYEGAGISTSSCELFVTDCTFSGNYADYEGAAISHFPGHFQAPGNELQCINSVFSQNVARVEGGVLDARGKVTFYNSLFEGNSVGRTGGVFDIFQYGTLAAINCTFVSNVADLTGSILDISSGVDTNQVTALFGNCIFSDNQSSSLINTQGAVDLIEFTNNYLSVCPVGANCTDTNIYGTEPGFAGNDDFRLNNSSPCIDVGEAALLPVTLAFDLAGNPRISGAGLDLGAYESDKPSSTFSRNILPIHFYPNPAEKSVFVSAPDVAFHTIVILNLQGQEVFRRPFLSNVVNQIPVKELAAGAYLIRLLSSTGEATDRLIVR